MLNKTNMVWTVCALALTIGIGIPVFASGESRMDASQHKQRIELTAEQKAEFESKRGGCPELTDEQKAEMKEKSGNSKRKDEMTEEKKAEMEAKRAEMKAKWESMTDEEKAEIQNMKGKHKGKHSEGDFADKMPRGENSESGKSMHMKGQAHKK